jgi:hypothetical protein
MSNYGQTEYYIPVMLSLHVHSFYIRYFTSLTTVKIIYAPNPTWTDVGSNPCLCHETPATHRLYNCTPSALTASEEEISVMSVT